MDTLEEIEKYAKENYIPIARKKTVEFLINLIKEKDYTSFFEIGTAIGYTSSILALTFPNIEILTIEHNHERAKIAKENFKKFKINNKINFIEDDAVTFETDKNYDLIFIDAAKKKNLLFLEKFAKNLSEKGTIIVDNMNLDDFNKMAKIKKQNYYKKVNEDFINHILSSPYYDAELHQEIGDGIMIIKLK